MALAAAAARAAAPRMRGWSVRASATTTSSRASPTRPTRRWSPALAAWCAERGLLITELRLGAASLEERYLELVGADAAAEAEGEA